MSRALFALAAAAGLHGGAKADVAMCPGESDRYGDHKCNHDPTHRFCAQLLDSSGQPLSWGPKGDFWEITGQKAFQWDDQIRANNGDSWCICMWAAARMITEVGCDNVHLHCEASDVDYILKQYSDGGVDLEPAKQCLQQKCKGASSVERFDAEVPQISDGSGATATSNPVRSAVDVVGVAAVAAAFVAAGVLLWDMRSRWASRSGGDADMEMASTE